MREILGGSNMDVLSATNLTLKHASGGEVVLRVFDCDGRKMATCGTFKGKLCLNLLKSYF